MAESIIINDPIRNAINNSVEADQSESAQCVDFAVQKNRSTPRVWLLTNLPSPYQVELLSNVNRVDAIDLHVRFMRIPPGLALQSCGDATLQYREFWGAAPKSWRDEFRLHPGAIREAAFGKFDCFVLSGLYTSITFMICAAVLTVRRKPWAVWLEQPRTSNYRLGRDGGVLRTNAVQSMKRKMLHTLLRHATRVIGMGTAAVRAYQAMGVNAEKLASLPYCCDINRFANADGVCRVRQRYGLDGKVVFLFSGQMIARKGVDTVLSAFRQLAGQHEHIALLLLGDGPQRQKYERSVPSFLKDRVHFAGQVQQSELPQHFAAADVFVFPSRHDGWGVVVNEACAAGLPIIASKQTGAALDLVEEGANGWLVECEDIEGFALRMSDFIEHPEQIRRFGQRSTELARQYSTFRGARRFSECVLETIGAARR